MKKQIVKTLLCLMIIANFSPKTLATNIDDDFEINYIDKFSVTITKNQHIEVDGKKCKLGESAIASFGNTQEGRSHLSEHISGNLLSSILDFWDSSASLVRSSKKSARLSKSGDQTEVTIEEYPEIDNLNSDQVIFLINKKVEIDGTSYTLGEPQVVSYENSLQGRQVLSNEIDEPFYSLVMAIWGENPTIIPEEPQTQSQD